MDDGTGTDSQTTLSFICSPISIARNRYKGCDKVVSIFCNSWYTSGSWAHKYWPFLVESPSADHSPKLWSIWILTGSYSIKRNRLHCQPFFSVIQQCDLHQHTSIVKQSSYIDKHRWHSNRRNFMYMQSIMDLKVLYQTLLSNTCNQHIGDINMAMIMYMSTWLLHTKNTLQGAYNYLRYSSISFKKIVGNKQAIT